MQLNISMAIGNEVFLAFSFLVNILFRIHSFAPVGVSRGGIVFDRLLNLSSLEFAENCGQHPLELRQVLVVQHWLYDDLKFCRKKDRLFDILF